MDKILLNPIVKGILDKYYPTIQAMIQELSLINRDELSINTACGSVTIKFKSYGINTEST